jgi:molybdopterin-guanine dinucleotide biosynthesis protein A
VARERTAAPVVAVLAGGAGSRIGGCKPAVRLRGRALISYPLDAARAAGLEAFVVAKRSSGVPSTAERVVFEPDRPQHPLCGIVTALRETGSAVVAVGCDMPYVSGELLARLASAEPSALAVAMRSGGALQPLPARYGPGALSVLERALTEEAPLRAALARLRPHVLDAAALAGIGTPERLCSSINDQRDLARAARALGAARAPG